MAIPATQRGTRYRASWPTVILIVTLVSCQEEPEHPAVDPHTRSGAVKTEPRGPLAKPKKRATSGLAAQASPGADQHEPPAVDPAEGPRIPLFRPELIDTTSRPPEVSEARLNMAGIRKIEGRHLVLYTDLPISEEVDRLPPLFDLAVPQWCKKFSIDPQKAESWKMVGHLMERKERFAGIGLLPPDLPPFLNGYQRGAALWIYDQPSDYYRRHMLLHEGTHAFMRRFLGGNGPPWYSEGMAELLGTHRCTTEARSRQENGA